jgi:hypothetical protein
MHGPNICLEVAVASINILPIFAPSWNRLHLSLNPYTMSLSRRIARSYAVANLKNEDEVLAASAKEKDWRLQHTAVDSGDNNTDHSPQPESPSPSGKTTVVVTMAANVVAADIAPTGSATEAQDPKPIMVRGKILLRRSPLPGRTNRNTHPGLIAKPRAKRTVEEVATAKGRKAALLEEVHNLEQQHIIALAALELQEALDEETEDRSVVRKTAEASILEGKVAEVPVDSEVSEDDDAGAATLPVVAPKPKQVCASSSML